MIVELWDVALLLLAAKIGGTLLSRLGQPGLIGELLAGAVVGTLILDLQKSTTVNVVAQLGIIFLILLTMLQIDLHEIEQEMERLVFLQVASALAIFVLLYGFFSLLGWSVDPILTVAAAIFGSSTAISTKTIASLGVIASKEGQAILGLQIVNGVMEILMISAVANMIRHHALDVAPILSLALMIIGTLAVMSRFGSRFVTWLVSTARVLRMEEVLLALTLLLAFSMAAITEMVGMTSYYGVMLIGILLSRTESAHRIACTLGQLGESFFIPVFFATLGLGVSFASITGNLPLLLLMFSGITLIRFVGFTFPLILQGNTPGEAIKIGAGMLTMSEYGLLMLGIGLSLGALDQDIYSILVVVFLLVNILAPVFMSLAFGARISRRQRSRSIDKFA
ncbi:MAG: cation:proton antiporter [Methanomicrobiales archaeon]|nr:cation:proton antiporter [Methanomicrobiales archaeon]